MNLYDSIVDMASYITANGADPSVILTTTKGSEVWDALEPLVHAGTITEDERLMLLVCVLHARYPVVPE